VSGGVVLLGDRVFLTRPVQEGYGLIRVGIPGIRGFAEGQEIGRTDRRGDLLVPRLLPYYANRIGIADTDVPVEYQIGATELLAAPALRGGVVTRFDVAPLRAVLGELLVAGPEVAPAFGELRLRAAARDGFSSPIGGDGRFYLESVPPGTHRAEAEWSGGRCSVTIVVPPSPPVADLGSLRCEPDGPAPILVQTPATATTGSRPKVVAVVPSAPSLQPSPVLRADEGGGDGDAWASLPVPPPRGFGPRTPRCPSCTVCVSAALNRLSTPTAQSRCVSDLTAMQPSLGRAQAARMCLAKPDWDDLCARCVRLRTIRRCPTWPAEPGAGRRPSPLSGRGGGGGRTAPREWDWTPFASGPRSWTMMSGFQDLPARDRSP
jgi:hypothetical protein